MAGGSSSGLNSLTAVLKHLFATHGLQEFVVSDNGTAFTSIEFGMFMKRNGIRHI